MRDPQDNVKVVLLDLVSQGSSWESAYAELIGSLEENVREVESLAYELEKKLREEKKTEAYIKFRLEGFQCAYEREIMYLNATRILQDKAYRE